MKTRENEKVLFENLVVKLSSVYDAHGVCAAAVQIIAANAKCKAFIALFNPLEKKFDIWIKGPDEPTLQFRLKKEILLKNIEADNHGYILHKSEIINELQDDNNILDLINDSFLGVSLSTTLSLNDRGIDGAVCLFDPPQDCVLDLNNIETLGTHISVLLDRALLRQLTDQQSIEFGIVTDISSAITSTLKLDQIVNEVTNLIQRALGVKSVSISLVTNDKKQIRFFHPNTGDKSTVLDDSERLKPEEDNEILDWVVLNSQSIMINIHPSEKNEPPLMSVFSKEHQNSILCTPLILEQRVIGVVKAIHQPNKNFYANDLRLLQAINGPLAIAIENANLHTNVLSEKRRVETIFESMSDGLVLINRDGIITGMNTAFLTLINDDFSNLIRKPFKSVVLSPTPDLNTFLNDILEARIEFEQIACDIQSGNGKFIPVLIGGASIRNDIGTVEEVILVISDLYKIREIERMRDDFFTNIIHELHTPLASILMYARLLREGKALGDEAKSERFLSVIEDESNRLQKMVRQMLHLAKLESRQISDSSRFAQLESLFAKLLPTLNDQASEKGLLFNWFIQENLPPVHGNEDDLFVVFKNIIENSIKFSSKGSIFLDCRESGGFVIIRVSDEGVGIPQYALPHIFQRFYRAQSTVELGIAGTGLGLYMVHEAVEQSGGSIEVESEEGIGTTIIVSLPIANQNNSN